MPTSNPRSPPIHTGPTGRAFPLHPPVPCYDVPAAIRTPLPPPLVAALGALPPSARTALLNVPIPARSARAFYVPAGALLRLELPAGSQVADLNFWNADNHSERFYASKTRQLHSSHLSVGHSLWSCMPYIRPLATLVADSVAYGLDRDGAGVHDVIGSRCDPYTHAILAPDATPTQFQNTCHANLTSAVRAFGLAEDDVHDVFNAFMCTGFTRDKGVYFCKPSPARRGDYIELFAHVRLLVAVAACPQGDVSVPCGSAERPSCWPLAASVWGVPGEMLRGWREPKVSSYRREGQKGQGGEEERQCPGGGAEADMHA